MGSKILAGRYELLEKTGDGGMAVVYKAKDRLLNRFVAIKILKPEFIRDPKFIESFRRESQAAAGLSHQNIVSVFDVGKEGNIYYIVMELLDGYTLADIIKREAPMDEKKVINIARQIAAGLSSAHRKKIIHRDVKPHNILMDSEGNAKIADFGIAKAVNSGTIVNSKTSTVMGSVHYLSPEQAKGSFSDARTDIYSLGIVMYEMLTGSVPFDGENPVSVAMMHINGDVPAPSFENPTVSPIMDAIVLKATSRVPGDRFASADDLITALNNAEHHVAMVNSGATSVYGLRSKNENRPEAGNDDVELSSFEDLEGGSGYSPVYSGDDSDDEDFAGKLRRKKKKKPARNKAEAKKHKKSKILGVVLALICAVPLSLFIMNSCDFAGGGDVPVPNVVGMTEDDAVRTLEAKGLEYKLGTPVLSDEYESGLVVSTDPEAGKKVRDGYKVTIVLSRGSSSEEVKAPNCVGKSKEEGKQLLELYKLKMGSVTEEVSDLPAGTIIRQTPDAGEAVKEGTEVAFVISKGGSQAKVPNLMGLTKKEAESALKDAKLILGKVTEEENPADKGCVIGQSVSVGEEVAEGTRIDIVISIGEKEEEDVPAKPVDISMKVDYGSAQNEVFTLTVTVTDSNGIHYIVNNQQRIKSDGSETVKLTGSGMGTVRVIIDNEIVSEKTANFTTGELS